MIVVFSGLLILADLAITGPSLGGLLILGVLAIGSIGTPIFCPAVGAWRASGLAHVRIGWGVAVGFGIGIGTLLINIVVAVFAYQALVDAAPMVSGEWVGIHIALICPFLAALLAVSATWIICNRKERSEQVLRGEAVAIYRDSAETVKPACD